MTRGILKTLRKLTLLDFVHYFLKENAHVNFLLSMVLLVVLSPYLEENSPGDLGVTLVSTYNILATLYFIIHDRKNYFIWIFSILILAAEWMHYLGLGDSQFGFFSTYILLASKFGITVLFGLALIKLFGIIFNTDEVDLNVIISSISGYMAVGLMGAFGFDLLTSFFPTEFEIAAGNVLDRHDMVYFSFVTMSTLGYGDIVPTGGFARGAAVLLTLTGQMYMTMVIAVLIGKFLATNRTKKQG